MLAQGDGDEEDSDFWSYLEGGDGGSGDDSKQHRTTSSRGIGSTPSGLKERKNLVGALKEFKPKLFKVEADPTAPLQQVGLGTLVKKAATSKMGGFFKKDSLDDHDVFLLDSGWQIFVWIDKSADSGEKVAAMGAADRYAEMEPRARELPVTIIKAGQEKLGGFWSFFK